MMKPGFETTCLCATHLVWLPGHSGLVPVVKQYADRIVGDATEFSHVLEHEHSTIWRKLKLMERLEELPE